jgi:DNA invertase Pin-like site-specific DNA recombinase
MRIGYARVSTSDQNLDLQRVALKAAECERIFSDEGLSGTTTRRPGLDAALAALSSGDTLVVWKIDRLGRSLAHLVQLIADLGTRGIAFRSLSDPIDTGSAGGRLVLHMMGALAEFERSLIVERTQAGMDAARRRGQKLGRKPALTPEQVAMAARMIDNGESARAVARSLKIGKSTLYRHLPGARSAEAEAPL